MRFRGGGVGHRATREHTETMSQEPDTTIPDENDSEDNLEDELLGDEQELEDEQMSSESESDIGEGNNDEAEDEFDGEDGEEPWGIDEYTAEGYAPP